MSGPATTHRTEEHVLDQNTCTRLLGEARFGRLAYVRHGHPELVVLNHISAGDVIAFRVQEDSRLADAVSQEPRPVVFEVDRAFESGGVGWSVIAHGLLGREGDPERWAQVVDLLRPWAGGEREVVLTLRIRNLSGRRVGRLPETGRDAVEEDTATASP